MLSCDERSYDIVITTYRMGRSTDLSSWKKVMQNFEFEKNLGFLSKKS